MRHTSLSWMNTEELLDFAQAREEATELEIELAQRLEIALQSCSKDPNPTRDQGVRRRQ